jgi:lipopolysaccharide heptosyltransferase II
MIPINPSSTGRILIRANNWIGDVVMISPAIRAIRERFTRARIAMVAKAWVLEALGGNPCFDELLEYDPDGIHRGVAGRLRLSRALRQGGPFDLAVLFQKAFDAAVIARLAGARRRVGYATDGRSALLTDALSLPPAGTHHAQVFLGLARALGCEVRDPIPFFHLTADDRGLAASRIDRSPLSGTGPRVALHAGASKWPRAWHPDRYAALARTLHDATGARILLIGGGEETALLDSIQSELRGVPCFAPGPAVRLKEVAGILETCDLFVGNDSGPMHLAAALRIPTIGIFGPGRSRTTGPVGPPDRVAVIERDYPCAPCRQDFFRECPPAPSGKPFCIEEIGVDEVAAAAFALLASGRPGASRIPFQAPGQPSQA